MRLLNVKTLKLEDYTTRPAPKYTILSHCWRPEIGEILYEDVESSEPEIWREKRKEVAMKVLKACAETERLGFEYIWVDTCCIDKRSSSELSEAINSMFKWYRKSTKCIAFLDDIDGTLQELIAPDNVWFYNKNWSYIGDRFSMARKISAITRIDEVVLRHGHEPELEDWDEHDYREDAVHFTCRCGINGFDPDRLQGMLDSFSVATIMSWAAGRRTSREEDIAYCLMGLFDVNMPLLYGEKSKAFIRLQEQIIRRTNDQSILAWATSDAPEKAGFIWSVGRDLASSPDDFSYITIKKKWSLEDHNYDDISRRNMSVTKEGLEVDLLLFPLVDGIRFTHEKEGYIAILDCTIGDNPLVKPAIMIGKPPWSPNVFDRYTCNLIAAVTPDGSHFSGGTVSRAVAKVVVNSLDSTHSRNRFELPPLQIRTIEDCDIGEYDVDYALPGFDKVGNVALPCNESYGLALLRKRESPRFFVAWGLRISVPGPGHGTLYERKDIWCKVLPADDQDAMECFASAKEWGRHQRFENTSIRHDILNYHLLNDEKFKGVNDADTAVLDFGEFRRVVRVELKRSRFLGGAFLYLTIQVKLPPGRR
ncbi:heterokaryon incompatibility protein-domain-containing protein [Xylaria arbuscula]|nr:heterokaryon incompatibility protein-domain-containing protein [Xylaria arbuscula]